MNPNAIRLISGAASLLSNETVILFTSNAYSQIHNNAVTISWNVTNASSVSINQGIGAVAATGNASSSGVNGETKTFTLTAIGLNMISYTASFTVTWYCPGIMYNGTCYY